MSVVLRPLKRGLVNGARPDEVEGPDGAISGESAARGMVEHTMDDIIATDFSVVAKGEEKILEKGSEIRPFFSSAWVVPNPPEGSELLEEYYIKGTKVQLYHMGNETESLYHVLPFEYALPIEKIRLIYLTIKELRERHPSDVELNRQEQARAYIRNLNENIMIRLARRNSMKLGENRLEEIETVKRLAEIAAKYTAGFGLTETFLEDEHIQDVYIDAPASANPLYLTVGGLENERLRSKCRTNICLGREDYEALLSRFRFESGRPFSEAMPVLEHNLSAYESRVTAIGKPLSPDGIAIAVRRHSVQPWTLLRFMANKTLSAHAAGLISFLIDGKSTVLVAGSRGSGKTSLLGAIMLEFPQSQRILTIEDTRELPSAQMQHLGYKVQSMVVQSSLGGKGEMTTEEALRVSLRLGESAIVLGEVRGQEARTLYEAMRAGTAGSSVLGTFHADSAKSVFERVTHDMGIPAKSFLATDMVIIAGLSRPGGAHREVRRVKQIAEVQKLSGIDGHFRDLMLYEENGDELLCTEDMVTCSERIGAIAKSWGMDFEEALRNIDARAAYREHMVKHAKARTDPSFLTPKWVKLSNNMFWSLIEKHQASGQGLIDYDDLLREWTAWFDRSATYE